MTEKIGYYIVTYILLFIGSISKSLTIQQRGKFGEIVGDFLRLLSYKRQFITLDNITNAFPEKDQDWVRKTMIASYRNLGITMVELLAFESFDFEDFQKYIEFENIELAKDVYSRGNGMILLSGHFGNWELVAFTISLFSRIPISVIVKPQKNYISDKILNSYRKLSGNSVIYNDSPRKIMQTFLNKGAIGILADQSATVDKDLFIDFFGRKAATYEAPATLALKFHAPIIMGFPVRQEDYTYKVRLFELDFSDLKNDKDGVYELTKRHVKVLENIIREYPHLWSWQHRRWKHTLDNSND